LGRLHFKIRKIQCYLKKTGDPVRQITKDIQCHSAADCFPSEPITPDLKIPTGGNPALEGTIPEKRNKYHSTFCITVRRKKTITDTSSAPSVQERSFTAK
jgi:hypothetical protein